MSDQEKQKKAKLKEFAYKAADKVGHFVRKYGPSALMGIVLLAIKDQIGKKGGSNKA